MNEMNEMNEMEFHTKLRNAGLFLTLSFTSIIYYHSKNAKGMNNFILLLSFMFNLISTSISIELFNKTNKYIPKYILGCNLIILIHIVRLLFKQ
jgi:hypothetical protein